jgi:hypothetical protein
MLQAVAGDNYLDVLRALAIIYVQGIYQLTKQYEDYQSSHSHYS